MSLPCSNDLPAGANEPSEDSNHQAPDLQDIERRYDQFIALEGQC